MMYFAHLQSLMEKDVETWTEKGLGIKLSDEERKDCISNLRFADDVLMMAASLKQLKKMIADFEKSTEAQGLEIHPSKTKILTNQKTNKLRETEIDVMYVEILPPERKVKHFGADDHMRGQRNHRGATQDLMRSVRTRQTSTGTDIPILPTCYDTDYTSSHLFS